MNPRAPADSPCELLPCPFCGGHAQITAADHGYQASCDSCDVSGRWFISRLYTVKAWNTRAAPPVLSARPNEADIGNQCSRCGRWRTIRESEGKLPDWPSCCQLVCHCSCHNDPLYCHSCNECDCHKKDAAKNEADAPRGQAVDLHDAMLRAAYFGWQRHRWDWKNIATAIGIATDNGADFDCLQEAPPPSPVGNDEGGGTFRSDAAQ